MTAPKPSVPLLAPTLLDDEVAALLDAHAPFVPVPFLPALCAWQAVSEVPLWEALEARCDGPVPPPFFCVAWPGAQVLAWAVTEGLIAVDGQRVVDVGSGSGLAACAAARAGACAVTAIDVDGHAVASARVLARRHGVQVSGLCLDVLANPAELPPADVVLVGDLVSSARHANGFAALVAEVMARGTTLVVADSGRPFFEPRGLAPFFSATLALPGEVDGGAARTVTLYR